MPENPYQPPKEVNEAQLRRFQFTLRGLLFVALAASLAADWLRRYLIVSIIFDSTANPGGAAEAAAAIHWPYFLAESLILLIAIPILLIAALFSLVRGNRTLF